MKIITKRLFILMLIQISRCAEKDMEAFVVGGAFANIAKYPHSAYLDARCKPAEHWICGSSILNQRIVLTAAHCVDECDWKANKKNRLIAYVGNSDLRKVTVKRKIIDVRMHPSFVKKTLENDIAVAMARNDFPFGRNIKRIIITQNFPGDAYDANTYVAGWGVISDCSEDASNSINLKHVSQKIRAQKTCALIGHLHEGMFCAGNTEKAAHPAQGDSGSALVTATGYHQIGVVSFRIKRYPSLMVYTNVSYYFKWILANAKLLYCSNQN